MLIKKNTYFNIYLKHCYSTKERKQAVKQEQTIFTEETSKTHLERNISENKN